MYKYLFSDSALRDIKKLPVSIQRRIIGKLDYFVASQDPLVFASRLINSDVGGFRFRVGDYRIIFDIEGEELTILAVGHRREIYR